jgi:hypothetical protein
VRASVDLTARFRSLSRRGSRGWLPAPAIGRIGPASLAVLALCVLAGDAIARPGGGDAFSGGGGHGGSGGGDDGGFAQLIYWLIRLVIEVPQIGLPLLAITIGYFLYSSYKQHQNKDWDSGPPVALEHAVDPDEIRRVDPDFSQILFEDFAFRLFSTAHRVRHAADTLATVAPYVGERARHALQVRPPAFEPVQSVVVGALRLVRVSVPNPLADDVDDSGRERQVRIAVELEANVTTASQTAYSVETWTFARDAAVRTRPPAPGRGFPCPNCGAPWQASESGTQRCASCGEIVDNGRFDWVVEDIQLRSLDQRPPTLTHDVPERGTDLPTYREPDLDRRLIELERRDPAITEAALHQRLALIHGELGRAWTANELGPVRGLVSDGLYDYLQYWIDAYRQQGLRNELVDQRITHAAAAKVTHDKWYDAVTIRFWATGKDYVVRIGDGSVVRGSRRRERAYSEYWTLIRSAGRRGPATLAPQCPNCAAPLQIARSGACEYCGAHVTAGEFDWVLSKIEQDDTYRG